MATRARLTAQQTALMRRYASSTPSGGGHDIRSQLLQEALKFIPETGFSLRTLQKAAASVPALQQWAQASPLALEQLFPSPPSSSFSSTSSSSANVRPVYPSPHSSFTPGEAAQESPLDRTVAEPSGPVRALFEAWTEDRRKQLRDAMKGGPARGNLDGLKKALETRLGYNIPVLPFLPTALGTISGRGPGYVSLPSFSGFLYHARSIAYDIKDITRAETSLTRLATVYSLLEAYQTGPSKPTMEQTMRYADTLLKSTGKVDEAVRETWRFAGYVAESWKNIIRSRGL